jgi:hypothetical protein
VCRAFEAVELLLSAMKQRHVMTAAQRLTRHMKANEPSSTNKQNAHAAIMAHTILQPFMRRMPDISGPFVTRFRDPPSAQLR